MSEVVAPIENQPPPKGSRIGIVIGSFVGITICCWLVFVVGYLQRHPATGAGAARPALSTPFKLKALVAFEDITNNGFFILHEDELNRLATNVSDHRLVDELREYAGVVSDLHSTTSNLYMTDDLKTKANDLHDKQAVMQYDLDHFFKENGLLSERQKLIEEAMKPAEDATVARKHIRK